MTSKLFFRHLLKAFLILLGLLFVVGLFFLITSLFLHVQHYTVEADVSAPIRIVQLTDLHNAQFGKGNRRLIERVAEQEPDLILMTGDMQDRDVESTEIVEDLIRELSKLAPVYYGYGNHETTWEKRWGKDLHKIFSAAGATVLECEYVDVEVNGQQLRIGGYMGYWWQPHMTIHDPEQKERHYQFFHDFKETDRCMILLNHIPTQWLDWNYIDTAPAGTVFCGHYHGGIIRIPIWDRGLVAPYVGWFPPYTKGVFVGKESTCVLSTGLGIEHHIPRWNNPPEILVADLVPGTDA